jgi:hypothetical protein
MTTARSALVTPLLAVALILPCLGVAAGASPDLTLAAYRAALLKARALALALPGERAPAALQQRIAAVLPLEVQVRMPSGSEIGVDNRPLLRLLAGSIEPGEETRSARPGTRARRPVARLRVRAAPERWRFVTALDQLLAALGVPLSSRSGTTAGMPALDAAAADRVLRQVLARPEYQYTEPKPTLIDRFLNWLGDEISRFFNWLGRLLEGLLPASQRTPGRADQLARLMVVGVVLLLAVLIARIILVILPNLRRRSSAAAELPAGELLVPWEPGALLAEAEREAAAGHYREALRLAYLAAVARLDRAGILPEDRSRTHWELLRDLRRTASDEQRVTSDETSAPHSSLVTRHSSLVSVIAPLTQRLDERLFGGRATTVEDYQAGRAAYDQIERLLCAPA